MRWWQSHKRSQVPVGTHGLFQRSLVLTEEEVRSHIQVQGKTGSGKSRWLAALCRNLRRANYSFTLIDPHGDLSRLVLRQLVADDVLATDDAYDQLVYLDIPTAARANRYLRFNYLSQPYDTHTTTRLMLEAMRRAFPSLSANGTHSAPAFEQIVTAGVHVLVEHGLPFPKLRDLLLTRNKPWRDQLLASVSDELVVSYFRDEFDEYTVQELLANRGSTMRRLFLLLYSPILRYALSAPDNLLEYRSILAGNKSVIVNLAVPDPDAKRLLGSLMTVAAEQGAKSRADLPPETRYGTHMLIVDECQLFLAQSSTALSDMLSQTRKFGLFVVLSHQTRDQIPEAMRGGLQNVEIDITFRTGREDAEYAAKTVGKVDPLAVKHEVADESAAERSHPTFYSLPEQWEAKTQEVQDLPKRHMILRHPSGKILRLKTPHMPDPVVNAEKLAEVEEYYLKTCFVSADRIVSGLPPVSHPTTKPARPVVRYEQVS